MKTFFTKAVVTIWLFALTFSSLGVGVHTLYCHCLERYEVSLFEIDDVCHDSEVGAGSEKNHHRELAACCSSTQTCSSETPNEDCNENSVEVVKADLKFLESKPLKLEIPLSLFQPDFVFSKLNWSLNFRERFQNDLSDAGNPLASRAPPRYFGRFLLNLIQIYRC
jgi:thiazolylpeptide-type bacteriocin precursor